MIDVYNIQQSIERAIVRESGGGGKYRQIYTTQINRQKDSQIERKGRQVQIDVHNIEVQIDRQFIERRGRQVQIDVYNIEQQIDREIVRQRGTGGGGRYSRQMYTTQNNIQKERQLDREEEEEGTNRCIQHRTIDRQIDSLSHRSIDRQRDSQIKRKRRRRQIQIDVHNIKQQINIEIVRQKDVYNM